MSSELALDGEETWVNTYSLEEREELAYRLLASLPRTALAKVHRKIAPFLQLDIVGLLPTELALHIFSFLPYFSILSARRVSSTWRTLADDQALWKNLCHMRGWAWKDVQLVHHRSQLFTAHHSHPQDDEGVGEDEPDEALVDISRKSLVQSLPSSPRHTKPPYKGRLAVGPTTLDRVASRPDFKLLYQTHMLLRARLLHSSYRLSTLQTRDTPNAHTSTIYCLQLFTLPEGRQVLFTGSRDTSIRQWDLSTGKVERILDGVHDGSVLSLCAHGQYIASAGSDGLVAVWDIATGKVLKVINDHLDSALCVRFDDTRLVSCSKDYTVRTYLFPDLEPHLILDSHRAAVNAVALSSTQIVSASGDRSISLWDANTGARIHCFEGHHARGIASIDFSPPFIVSGSSDKHVRLVDSTNLLRGWSTNPTTFDAEAAPIAPLSPTCETCGGDMVGKRAKRRWSRRKEFEAHRQLVRTVVFGGEFVLSGSYDQTVKVWDRKTGALVADLTGGHMGRVFCVGFDATKIVSCGEDQKICIYDFGHGIDTSFVKL